MTDIQMYACKALQIPHPGRHPPSVCIKSGSASIGYFHVFPYNCICFRACFIGPDYDCFFLCVSLVVIDIDFVFLCVFFNIMC